MMTLEEAKTFLTGCKREELRDHSFGDVEVSWMKDGAEVASGYFGGSSSVQIFNDSFFDAGEADQLRQLGTAGGVSRNDSTGPDEFSQGHAAPGLSLEAVRAELDATICPPCTDGKHADCMSDEDLCCECTDSSHDEARKLEIANDA